MPQLLVYLSPSSSPPPSGERRAFARVVGMQSGSVRETLLCVQWVMVPRCCDSRRMLRMVPTGGAL